MLRRLLVPTLVALTFAACAERKATAAPTPAPALGREVRARVNGVPITGEQLAARLSSTGLGAKSERATAARQQAALDQAILEELQAQQAASLGLSSELDAGTDAKALDARRHDLARQYRLSSLLQRAQPTPDEVKAFFARHQARLQNEFELQVIAFDRRARVDVFTRALAEGKRFDDAAGATYPNPPEPKPWLPAKLTFSGVSPAFWPTLDALRPGQVSSFIPERAGGERGWIVRLVSRAPRPEVTLEQGTPAITAFLQQQRFAELRAKDEQELRTGAKIELAPGP